MHQRTWLSLLTFPLIVTFTIPMFHQQAPRPAKVEQSVVSLDDPLAGLADIQDVLAIVRTSYVDVPDMEKTLAGGIQGALKRVNLLNSYLTPEETQLPDPGQGETGLVLLKYMMVGFVAGVVPGSPAAAAGFQIGDWIRKMDGESLDPMSHWAIERNLKGSVGSEIALVRMPSGSSVGQKKIVLKREKLSRPGIELSIDVKAVTVVLPDLSEGRANELKDIFKKVDTALPLVVDLRKCIGGSYEEAAKVASLLGCSGLFATLQETGKPDVPINVPSNETETFQKIAVLIGSGTIGPAEVLAAALKHIGDKDKNDHKATKTVVFLGEYTFGQAVECRRFSLKQGGAVELVTRRWMGSGGERLDMGSSNGRLSRTGIIPDYSLRGIPDDEELLPRILEALHKTANKPNSVPLKVASVAPGLFFNQITWVFV